MNYPKEQFPIEVDTKKRIIWVGKYKFTRPAATSSDERQYAVKFAVLEANLPHKKVEKLRDLLKEIYRLQNIYFALFYDEERGADLKSNTKAWVKLQISLDRQIGRYLGHKFNRRLYMKSIDLWVKPEEKLLYKTGCLGFARRGFYSFDKRFVASSVYIKRFWLQLKNIHQAIEDNNENLLPLMAFFNKNPSQLKKMMGKGLWKQLSKNSRTRNIVLMEVMGVAINTKMKVEFKVRLLRYLNQLSSTRLKVLRRQELGGLLKKTSRYDGAWEYLELLIYCETKKPKKTRLKSDQPLHIVQDTKRMADRLGERFSLKWSWRRMLEAHDDYMRQIDIIRLEKLSSEYSEYSDAFDWLSEYKEVEKEAKQEVSKLGVAVNIIDQPIKLAHEARVMKHCVLGYLDIIANQSYMVVSIETSNSRSTLGLYWDKNKDNWQINQHYASYNDPVKTEEELEAARIVYKLIYDYSEQRRKFQSLDATCSTPNPQHLIPPGRVAR